MYACNGIYDRKNNDKLYLCKPLQKGINIIVIIIFTIRNNNYKNHYSNTNGKYENS